MKLYIFKTNIRNKKKIRFIQSLFKKHALIKKWSVDLEDVDKVMRVESNDELHENEIIRILKHHSFSCELLPD